MLTVDGSVGEGGGQILRTSLALSLCLDKSFHIVNLRANRKKPGLRRQHLACVEAAEKIGGVRAEGAAPGSRELIFVPKTIRPGRYEFDIGTAGSTTLVLQSVLPALMTANHPSTLPLKGGTHNPLVPSFDFLQEVFLPIINRMGPKVLVSLDRPGYFPKSGGKISAVVKPARKFQPICFNNRGKIKPMHAAATVAGLLRHIAERELNVIKRKPVIKKEYLRIKEQPVQRGPGNIAAVEIKSEHIAEMFTG